MITAAGLKEKASYTLPEAARILGVSENTFFRMVEDGIVTTFRPRGHKRVDIWELERILTSEVL